MTMKYLALLAAGFILAVPQGAEAAIAKLGATVETTASTGLKGPGDTKKGDTVKYDCLSDTDCAASQKCGSNGTCVSICTMGNPICSATDKTKKCLDLNANGNPRQPHKYECVECLAVSDCGAGYTCNKNNGYKCEVCPDGVSGCNCPSGQVANGQGGCKTPTVPANTGKCKWYDYDTGFFSKNANGSISVPSSAGCWDVYGANATVSVPNKTYDFANIRMWQGATVNGSFTTNELTAHLNTNQNAHTINFTGKVTVNGSIKYEKQVQLNFKGGIAGNYKCYEETCKGNYGPCTTGPEVTCPWKEGTGAPNSNWTRDQKTEHCRKICGDDPSWGNQRFYYDRPGAMFGGKEEVCTRYPKSCGYGCTYGWTFVYGTSINQPYTCQTAKQN